MGSQEYRALNKPSLPGMYEPLARPAGVVGAIVVESSSWIDDNLWCTLDACAGLIFVHGGGLREPDRRGRILGSMQHFARDPLYRAIRSSRFYSEEWAAVTLKQDQVANLKALADATLALDTANPSMGLMRANVMLVEAIPTCGSSWTICLRSIRRRRGSRHTRTW